LDPLHALASYDFELPEELIAQSPAKPRDSSRLLVLHREDGRIEHRRFTDLPGYLARGDLIVANNTRVLKARLLGRRILDDGKPGGKVEILLLEELSPRRWEGLFHASAKYVPGLRFEIPTPDGRGLRGVLVRGVAGSPQGTVEAEFDRDPLEADAGQLPLPHYIKRGMTWGGPVGGEPGSSAALGPTAEDDSAYQTVYAREAGSAAAPTAGLHFTDRVMSELKGRGVSWAEVTLHVGLGTFRPVKDADVRLHQMHEERFFVPDEVASAVTAARAGGGKILAVGTTTVRTLESAAAESGSVRPGRGRTSLFIRPGAHEFRAVDRMLTNFHLPRSTLLMMISAFAGRELVMEAYRQAVRERYRFFSYGDAMLIL
jgi:S-adenosylmethionine:tRNA ribosyltransferase-isomerase